jgi:hypothetical protein
VAIQTIAMESAITSTAKSKRPSLRCLRSVFAVALVLQRHRDVEAVAPFAGALHEQFAVATRPFLRDAWRFLDQALEVVHLPAQILFESGEFLLLLIERRVGANASACHGAPNDSGRSGKRK